MIFSKLKINKITLQNRVAVSPMCQYSAIDGCPSEWHYRHLSNLIESGAGLLTLESTAVCKEGKISHNDLCLYNLNHLRAHKRLVKKLKTVRNIPIILQISHSGRKGSAKIPWKKKNTPLSNKNEKWQTYAPSPISLNRNWPIPKEMSKNKIKQVIKNFVNSAKLAFEAGYDGIEIHIAHGYLLHQFFSPISNKRKDEYGLYAVEKYKIHNEILKSIKKLNCKNKIIGARVTGSDHLKKGATIRECINLVNQLKKNGLNYICVSSGGVIPKTNMKITKGFRIKMASTIKKKCKIITRTSGMIDNVDQINTALKKYKLDFLALGRKFINDRFFLLKNDKIIKKKYISKQYTYCI
jgi:2,4-dienoyl-CoA reductase-like NADH-dependent reductase (Old Yellow Enzyme family)